MQSTINEVNVQKINHLGIYQLVFILLDVNPLIIGYQQMPNFAACNVLVVDVLPLKVDLQGSNLTEDHAFIGHNNPINIINDNIEDKRHAKFLTNMVTLMKPIYLDLDQRVTENMHQLNRLWNRHHSRNRPGRTHIQKKIRLTLDYIRKQISLKLFLDQTFSIFLIFFNYYFSTGIYFSQH
ncbi:hypothetical protein FGO68_gene2647 [Halteria grandinella]|uniref:Uncharacterized protein n=1 Tax=Halteria grandinella TaxID=5974 RepID=A0A8J8T2W7_HALGN|nr:hypothetical protein FGO68_gene2647 [Halteria grandinella]